MEKTYFRTYGEEPDVECADLCKFKEGEGVMVGSASCQDCGWCFGWDQEENWIKCLKYAMEKQENLTES